MNSYSTGQAKPLKSKDQISKCKITDQNSKMNKKETTNHTNSTNINKTDIIFYINKNDYS